MRDMKGELKFHRPLARALTLAIVLTLVVALGQGASHRESAQNSAASSPAADAELSPGGADLIQPDELAKAMQAPKGEKPVVLYVGPRFLWVRAHIPGAEFIGSNADPRSVEKLRARAAELPRDRLVVLYCGCCPWEHCPNIRPAFQQLREAGLARVRTLYLANSFATDWVARGFPVTKGEQ